MRTAVDHAQLLLDQLVAAGAHSGAAVHLDFGDVEQPDGVRDGMHLDVDFEPVFPHVEHGRPAQGEQQVQPDPGIPPVRH